MKSKSNHQSRWDPCLDWDLQPLTRLIFLRVVSSLKTHPKKRRKRERQRQICKGDKDVKMIKGFERTFHANLFESFEASNSTRQWFRPALGVWGNSWMDFFGIRAKNSCHESFLSTSKEFGKTSNADLPWMSKDWKSFPESAGLRYILKRSTQSPVRSDRSRCKSWLTHIDLNTWMHPGAMFSKLCLAGIWK